MKPNCMCSQTYRFKLARSAKVETGIPLLHPILIVGVQSAHDAENRRHSQFFWPATKPVTDMAYS